MPIRNPADYRSIVWVAFAVLLGYNPLSLEAMQQLTTETEEISRSAYLATQLPILWMYLRLFVWPVGLHLDYGTTALTGFMHLSVFVSLALHIAVIALGVWSWKRFPLVSFAILFYYLAHGIESSFIPIRDVVFEHRTYLPNLGLAILSAWILFDLLPRRMSMRVVTVLSLVIVIALGVTTWRRNQVWRDPITLWTSNTEEAPTKVRAWVHLGNYYIGADRPRDAERASMRAISIQLEQDSLAVVDRWAVCNLITSTYMLKNYDRALALTDQFIDQPMTAEQLTRFYVNQGLVYLALGRNDEAEVSFQKAIYLRPTDIPARENYARALAHQGRHIEAVAVLEELLRIDPGNEETRRLLQQFRTDIRRQSP